MDIWAHSVQSQWPFSPTDLTCASKGYLELDVDHRLKMQRKLGTRSFPDLLQWLDPPVAVLRRLGRLVGDQERNKSSCSSTKQNLTSQQENDGKLAKCQLVMATGGTVRSYHAVVNHEWLYARPFPDSN